MLPNSSSPAGLHGKILAILAFCITSLSILKHIKIAYMIFPDHYFELATVSLVMMSTMYLFTLNRLHVIILPAKRVKLLKGIELFVLVFTCGMIGMEAFAEPPLLLQIIRIASVLYLLVAFWSLYFILEFILDILAKGPSNN